MDRNQILERVRSRTTPWDIVVIGGGATGVGCAVDAASRGYDVLLVEQSDFGKGTSSRSTKLVHGGVRYLAQGNISLVREALKERGILLRNAPHVVHKQEFIVPCYSRWQKLFYGIGLKIYDLLSGNHSFGKSHILSRSETIERLPTLKQDGLAGGVLYYDGQFDDTRLLIDLVRTAHDQGATILNYVKVVDFLEDDWSSLVGVKVEDVETGTCYRVLGRSIINATGIFADTLRNLARPSDRPLLTFSQGIHLVFDRKFLPGNNAVMIPRTSDGRVLFCIPWLGYLLLGTTETPNEKAALEPYALKQEVDFILETAGRYLATQPTREDILSVFAGIRPLVNNSNVRNTASLSRSHELFVENGLITITGGKWTTYRQMAEEAVDKAVEIAPLAARKCVTEDLPIRPPRTTSGKRLHPNLPYNEDDIVLAVREEMAQTVEDVLARRTRALFLNVKAANAVAPAVAALMASELGKNETWVEKQVAQFAALSEKYLPALSDKLKTEN